MKNLLKITGILPICLLIIFAVSSVSSCTKNVKPEDSKEEALEENETKYEDTDKVKDAEFLVYAAGLNYEQIELGQLAQQQSKTQMITDLGKYIEEEHAKFSSELTGLAAKKDITIPIQNTEDGKNAYKKLDTKTGNEFDRTYSNMVLESQRTAILKFEAAAKDSKDADIKAWANASLLNLKIHSERAFNCLNESNKL